ncbi:MAG TPA: general stress protein [Opitutae bacterium]|nr:general stress protein [Opitutae bacterium]|tara:strand:+ start:683 stop:1645 length:963 start_codon:yes stop_codon:yes gene_type:complete
MKYIRCQGLDKDWSAITFGCWQIAPSVGWGNRCTEQEADAVVKTALDQGITAFDTAEGYGDGESERRLGKALGSKKDDMIVISKIWPDAELSEKAYHERLDQSLKHLGRDYVDVYLIHWPGDYFATEGHSARFADCMASLKASGKARLVGLSNFHAEDLRRLGSRVNEFSVNQVPYSLLEREYEDETEAMCMAAGIPFMAYSPTGKGLLARRLNAEDLKFHAREGDSMYSPELYPEALKVFSLVEEIAQERGIKPIEVALAWVLSRINTLTAIVGSKNPGQVADFADTPHHTLSEEEITRLTEASDVFHDAKAGRIPAMV